MCKYLSTYLTIDGELKVESEFGKGSKMQNRGGNNGRCAYGTEYFK